MAILSNRLIEQSGTRLTERPGVRQIPVGRDGSERVGQIWPGNAPSTERFLRLHTERYLDLFDWRDYRIGSSEPGATQKNNHLFVLRFSSPKGLPRQRFLLKSFPVNGNVRHRDHRIENRRKDRK